MCATLWHVNRADGLELCCRLLVVSVACGDVIYTYLLHCIFYRICTFACCFRECDHIDLFAQRAYILHNYFKYFLSQLKIFCVCILYRVSRERVYHRLTAATKRVKLC